MKELVSVLVPILNPVLSPLEMQILDHGIECLKRYPFIFVMSEDAGTEQLKERYPNVDIITFNGKYFESRQTLATLFLMEGFYERFSWSDFLFIHELNSWVVKDELHYWCKQGYDYLIGDERESEGLLGNIPFINKKSDSQRKLIDSGFTGNGLYLCHIERFLKTLKAKKKEAYAYRHQSELIHRDILFWELEANRFWPYLRRPTRIVQQRFSKNIISKSAASHSDREAWPFGLTGVTSLNIDDLPCFS